MTVRSAPVSTISVSGVPLRRASTVIGAQGVILSDTLPPASGAGSGRGCGEPSTVAPSRKRAGIVAGSAV
jgi:hypothetical protein